MEIIDILIYKQNIVKAIKKLFMNSTYFILPA